MVGSPEQNMIEGRADEGDSNWTGDLHASSEDSPYECPSSTSGRGGEETYNKSIAGIIIPGKYL